MLARHAEDLFWLGRYVERAEDTARMLDVTYHNLLESPEMHETTAWKELLEVLYLDAVYEGPLERHAVSAYLVMDRDNPGSIISAVGRTRDNARGLRDRISTELWEAINVFYLELDRADFAVDIEARAYEAFASIKSRCQLVSGVAAQTMPRDEGYRFLILGWLLERAEMTCRLLAVRYARMAASEGQTGFHAWVSVLKSVSAYEAYLKAHDAALNPTHVLEFLLLDKEFPRSILYCLQQVERLVGLLVDAGEQTPLMRTVGRVRARVEFCDVAVIVADGLEPFLEDLQREIYDVSEALEDRFFRAGTDLQLHSYRWA